MKYRMLIDRKDRTELADVFPTAGEIEGYRLLELSDAELDKARAIMRKEIGRVDGLLYAEDRHLYRLTADRVVLAEKYEKWPFTNAEWERFQQKGNKKTAKQKQKLDALLAKYGEDAGEERASVLSYKPGVYVSKTHGLWLPYRVKYAKNPGQPLLVFFHGGGSTGEDNLRPMWEYRNGPFPELFPWRKRKGLLQRDFTVLIPQHPKYTDYELSAYTAAVKDLSEMIAADAKADKNRIYCMGGSMGGRCTWVSAYLFPDYYACAMPIMGDLPAGPAPKELTPEALEHLKDLPIWVSHSADDPTVPIDRDDEAVAVLRQLGAPVRYTRVDGKGHHHLASYFFETEAWDEWLFTQKRQTLQKTRHEISWFSFHIKKGSSRKSMGQTNRRVIRRQASGVSL